MMELKVNGSQYEIGRSYVISENYFLDFKNKTSSKRDFFQGTI